MTASRGHSYIFWFGAGLFTQPQWKPNSSCEMPDMRATAITASLALSVALLVVLSGRGPVSAGCARMPPLSTGSRKREPDAEFGQFTAVRRMSVPLSLDALYSEVDPVLGPSLPAKSQDECAALCQRDALCQSWSFSAVAPGGVASNTTCFINRNPENVRTYFKLANKTTRMSGTPARPYVLWRSKSPLPVAQRTLMVVNWHWFAAAESIVRYMAYMTLRLPSDVDIVHVQPFAHPWSIINPWSTRGVLSYLSFVLASRALPGYRGYLFTNDDVFVVFRNAPLAASGSPWHGAIKFLPRNISLPAPWMWLGTLSSDKSVLPEAGNPLTTGVSRIRQSLLDLNSSSMVFATADGFSDCFYVPARHVDEFNTWAAVMGSNALFLEMAVPTIFALASFARDVNIIRVVAQNKWLHDVENQARKLKAIYVHPCKLTNPRCSNFVFGEAARYVDDNSWNIRDGQPWT